MISPDFPVLFSVPNPLMWSACRCVAMTAVSWPPQSCLIFSAIRGMCSEGFAALSEFGRSEIDQNVFLVLFTIYKRHKKSSRQSRLDSREFQQSWVLSPSSPSFSRESPCVDCAQTVYG